MKRLFTCALAAFIAFNLFAQDINWPTVNTEAKPGARWWWMGSAVDKESLSKNIEAYATAGMGSLEITPIYGVKNNEVNEIPFLSTPWMEMLKHTEAEANKQGMFIDMNNGTGWPFGGPDVSIEDAASRLIISKYDVRGGKKNSLEIIPTEEKDRSYAKLSRLMAFSDKGICIDLTSKVVNGKLTWKAPKGNWQLIAAFCGKTGQKVKRAAPGGEGYVMNHLSAKAVGNYLQKFEKAFAESNTSYPHNFFNDSYEVYKADWTEDLFEEFATRRGYKLEEHLPDFLSEERTDAHARIISDYRETIAELLLENFTRQWTNWAHKNGSKTRNQAHGSPGNLIDLYATVDVPECEGFGLSNFGIKGLRKDSLTRPNDSDISMLKYASSGAHIAGKPYTSSETFTWLTEHFRTSLSQCKPDMDLMFLSGVNRMYFHGTTYTPTTAQWPGWKFYASIDMSPTNSIWKDAPAFFNYITRCQSFLQMGQPDSDFLLYLPVYDMWYEQSGRLLMFDIHSMKKRAPRFIEVVNRIINSGYDVDYISDNFIKSLEIENNALKTSGGSKYKALIIPGVKFMPNEIIEKLLELARNGATIVFLDQYPEDVPGWGNIEERRQAFNKSNEAIKQLAGTQGKGRVIFGTDYNQTLAQTGIQPEKMKTEQNLSYIRRVNKDGHHYFISALNDKGIDAWLPLSVHAKSAMIYDPMTGKSGKAQTRINNGATEVYLQLASGQSAILKTFSAHDVQATAWSYLHNKALHKEQSYFTLNFIESEPQISTVQSVLAGSWTSLNIPQVKNTMATGRYTFQLEVFEHELPDAETEWILDLGDVRESARVRINGEEVATLWAVPFECTIAKYLKSGTNTIEIDVTNLPANRIADMDRRGIEWRKFKDINVVDIHYKATGYAHWAPVPSGLLRPVKIYTAKK
ncbi:glycosyl hydrolase family 2 [Bacteroides sp. 214]|uniref:alpha-L-rhamnosidase n=1 Tax=Bacteroides sp. 214 TaxID=2302935 RepID=UPI0013D11178|nr:glycosyl hydrolase [Bacteroides sp. 214]NDW11472.1 glycosyl hydrolase family 2 [Bacteroides sp. 214]